MLKPALKGILAVCMLGILGLLTSILVPRSYPALALEFPVGAEFWQLASGSRIAFYKRPADSLQHSSPIIYLHGGPGGHISPEILHSLEALTQLGYDIYAYDQIGSGQSARLADIHEYTVARHCQDLKAIIEEIGAEQVILLGHSWGAVLATLFAAEHADRVASLILSSPGPVFPLREELRAIPIPDSLRITAPPFSNREGNVKAQNLRSRFVQKMALGPGYKVASDEEADAFFDYLNSELRKSTVCDTARLTLARGGGGYYAHYMTMRSLYDMPDRRPTLKAIPQPVLVIKGQCDNQPWGYTQEYLQILPQVSFRLIPQAGHSIAVEQEEAYFLSIKEFLSSQQ